ncbi:MOSC domain-containing protein [Sporosarcina sp. HYO08]|uniref:MOSC domain-containing protein n=1 Tax=Sporosarcina sp. HYO08 TaxID=1759557 RepID=UPI000795B86F|nr:MOSC domain-containing protein [Sporosarcina sp. HYO08]KXH81924.1 sulfurase [Sporosarcina sp. HYO08]
MMQPHVLKIFTGKVKQLGDPNAKDRMDRQWESGMFKTEKNERVWLGKTALEGDEVADKINHGGPEKAVFAYPAKHYADWKKELKLETIDMGAMGENLAVHDMAESTVCIGDIYQLGDALIQVSQPRRPCWKPARRFRVVDLALRIQDSGRTGWYFRVLKEGAIRRGERLELIERPYPKWTIAACNEVMYVRKDDRKLASDLASCELLAESWRQSLEKRLQGEAPSDERRVFGPNKA